ncbi:hotdog fold domain-containing protein [Sorangium sp. So ce388]|uniref:hotdog fold domain-containing protein n=1 Tax=Sorangium sp. So ce388 TaxID=3133309 RepID=UPI003F5BC50A
MNFSDLSLASLTASSRRNVLRDLWDKLRHVPGGKRLFSKTLGVMAPYTSSIRADIEVLERGRAEATMRDRPGLRNHLRSVHAVALVNLAELTGNTALAYSLPEDARFIVAGLSIEYLKKARGTIRAVCECPVPDTSERREYQIPVSLRDATGTEVARATLRSLVGPKKQP